MSAGKIRPHIASFSITLLSLMPIALAQEVSSAQQNPNPDGSAEYKSYSDSMDRTVRFAADMRATLDRTTFDLEALLDSLDYDADSIVEFVSTAIAFEQYQGVLRGPRGTLFARAGNAIDQALLLAALLRDAGYDARIAGTELDAETAGVVLEAMRRPVEPSPPFADADDLLDVFARHEIFETPLDEDQRKAYRDYVRNTPSARGSSISKFVAETTKYIQAQLETEGAKIESRQGDSVLINEARQYFWVQYKDAASDPWTDIHPVFADQQQFSTPQVTTYISDEVPEELQHRFRFQVFIERKVGNRLEVSPVTKPWERPVANLVGVPLTFSNLSDAMMNTTTAGQSPSELLKSSTFLAPIFGSSLAPGASFFDVHGARIDPMVAQSSNSDFIATVGGAFSSAVGGLGSQSALPTLTAQWMEFTLISPDGEERIFRRTTFDRIGPALRRSGQVPANLGPIEMSEMRTLIQLHTFMIGVGALPRGYVIDSGLSRFEGMRSGIDELMSRQFINSASSNDVSGVPVDWANHLALFSIFDMADTIGPNHRNYRSGPGLVVHRIGLSANGDNLEAIDIVSNPRRVVDISDDMPAIAPDVSVQAGVWETAVEGVFLSGTDSFDTWRAFESAERNGAKSIVLVPGDSKSDAGLSADIRAAIDVDLENGYAIIVPRDIESIENAGWWRVNLQTGETLGQLHDGRGQVAEYLKMLGVAYSGALLGLSVTNCAAGASSHSSMGCCSVGNTLVTLTTFAAGHVARAPALLGLGTGIGVDAAAFNLPIGEFCEARYGWGSGYK